MATAVTLRDGLCISQALLASVLEGPEDFSDNPLFATVVQFAHSIHGFMHLTDDLVSAISQKMLFATRQISDEMAVLREDLDLHNTINPASKINIKQLKELQDMSYVWTGRQLSNDSGRVSPWAGQSAPISLLPICRLASTAWAGPYGDEQWCF
jgi:hypothetical protein